MVRPWSQHQCVRFTANAWPPVLSRSSPVKAAAQASCPPEAPLLLILLPLSSSSSSSSSSTCYQPVRGSGAVASPLPSRGGDGNKRRPVFRRPLLRLQRMWKQWASWDVHPSRAFKAKAPGNISCGQRQQSLTGFVPPTQGRESCSVPPRPRCLWQTRLRFSFGIVLLLALKSLFVKFV